jgi:hypothetical protein
MTTVTVNGHTYSDDSAPGTRNLDNGGHRTWFLPLVSDVVTVSGDAQTSATEAAASAATALAAPGTNATSTTTLTIGTGAQTLTIQAGKALVVGMTVKIANTSAPTNWMLGDITAYNSTTGALSVSVSQVNGSGTASTWTVSLSGPGVTGTLPVASGGTGATSLTANNVLLGNGTSAVQVVAPGTAGNVLTSNGTTWTSAAAGGSGEAAFLAAGAITQGRAVVLNSNGSVSQSVIAASTVGAAATFSANPNRSVSSIFDPSSNTFAIFYQDVNDSARGKVVLATVAEDNTITYGSVATFESAGISDTISTCYDPVTEQVIVAYSSTNGGTVKTGKINGGAITFGAATSTGESAAPIGVCYDTYVSRLLVNWRGPGGTQRAAVGTVSDTSISLGPFATVIGSNSNGHCSTVIHCTGLGINALFYNTGGRGQVRRAIINSETNTVSFGSSYQITDGFGADGYVFGERVAAWIPSLQRLSIVYGAGPTGNYVLKAGLFRVDGTTWIHTAEVTVDSGGHSAPFQRWPAVAYAENPNSLIFTFINQSNLTGRFVTSTNITLNSLSVSGQSQFQSTTTDMTTVSANSQNQFVISTYDNTNASAALVSGIAYAVTAPALDSRTRFIGFAKNTVSSGQQVVVKMPFSVAENQTGLTANTTYYLSSANGTTLTTSVDGPRVGRGLSATTLLVLGSNAYI